LAVGGNLNVANYGIACTPIETGNCQPKGTFNCSTLRAEGEIEWGAICNQNATLINAQLFEGSFACGGVLSQTNSNLIGSDDCLLASSTPLKISSFKASLQALTVQLSNLVETGATSVVSGGLVLTGSLQKDAEIFFVAGSQLAQTNSFQITNVEANTTIIVNVNGSSLSLGGFHQSGYDSHYVIFNFFEASSLSLSNIGWEGSILAPWADIMSSQGNINGQTFCNSYKQSGLSCMEQDWFPFIGKNPLCFIDAASGSLAAANKAPQASANEQENSQSDAATFSVMVLLGFIAVTLLL